jgi:Clostripain family
MAATPTASTRKPWAILAYTIAEDTATSSVLDTTAQRELKAICDAADFRRVSIAAQVDFKRRRGVYRGAIVHLEPKGRGFKDIDPAEHELWKLVRDGVREGRTAVRLQREAADLNAADAGVLQEFLQFGQDECPADRYVVSFFGHAAGPLGVFSDATPGSGAHDILRLPRLVGAFRGTGRRIDVLLFRDCFMNCLEAAYQLRHTTEFVVATQSLAPATGTWPWRRFMSALADEATSFDVGLGLAKAVGAFMDDERNRSGFRAVPYSLLDLSAADEMAARLAALTDAIEAARDDPARSRACAQALEDSRVGSPDDGAHPGDPALLDVPTMCERLSGLSGTAVARAAAALGDVVGSRLVRWHHSQTGAHRGTAVYYKPVRPEDVRRSYLQAEAGPVADDDAAHYRALALSKATGWHRIALDPLPVETQPNPLGD